ncbi:kinase-like domain, phloem protein 2-like protein [Tanacetum coccineum]
MDIYKKEPDKVSKTFLSGQNPHIDARLKIWRRCCEGMSFIHFNPGREDEILDFGSYICNIQELKILLDEELLKNAVEGTSSNHLKWKDLEHLKIRLNHIELATENFDEKYCIGSGGYGMVYKAQLEHFDNSISSLIDRENKCCDHMIFVYELASKGSLEDYMGDDQDKQKIIHCGIKSANILLGDNWEAKIADFGLSKCHPANQEASTINTNIIACTNTYLDPEYQNLAYDPVYTEVNEKGIAPIARDHYKKGTLMEIVDSKIKEEADARVFSLSKGPDKDSLDIFS